jgi:hypothetical protein
MPCNSIDDRPPSLRYAYAKCTRLIAPTPDEAALMILRRYRP